MSTFRCKILHLTMQLNNSFIHKNFKLYIYATTQLKVMLNNITVLMHHKFRYNGQRRFQNMAKILVYTLVTAVFILGLLWREFPPKLEIPPIFYILTGGEISPPKI